MPGKNLVGVWEKNPLAFEKLTFLNSKAVRDDDCILFVTMTSN